MKASTPELVAIGARMEQARTACGLSRPAFVEKYGGSIRTLENNEKGRNKPSSITLDSYMSMGANLSWILTGEGEMLLSLGASSQAQLQAGQAQSMIADPTTEGESPAQAYTSAARQTPDKDAALGQADHDVTLLVSRCIVAAEMVAEGKLDRQQQVALGLDTWGALSRIHGSRDIAARIGKITDADLMLLARFVYNTKDAMSQR